MEQFERALAGGADERAVLTDQALSFDLIGEQATAQTAYARALALDPRNDEARRRLAVSHAISGNRARFEEALRPLLDKRDMAAFRARAFGLAIMGDSDRATAIVEQVMPRDLALDGTAPTTVQPMIIEAAMIGLLGLAYRTFGKSA